MRKSIGSDAYTWARTLFLLFAIALFWVNYVSWDAFLYGTVFVMAPWAGLLVAGGVAAGQVRLNAWHRLLFAMAAIFALAALRNGNLSPRGLLIAALGCAAAAAGVKGFGGRGDKSPKRRLYRLACLAASVAFALLLATAICEFFGQTWLPWAAKPSGRLSANVQARLARERSQALKGLTVLTYVLSTLLVGGIAPASADDAALMREARLLCRFVVLVALVFLTPAVASVFLHRPIVLPWFPTQKIGIQDAGLIGDRIRALQHPNKVAQLAVLGLFAALYLILNGRGRRRGLLIPCIVVFVMALAHAQSRGSNIALGLGIGALAFRAAWLRLPKRGWRVPGSLAAGALALALSILLVGGVFTADVFIATRLNAGAAAEEAAPPANLLDSLRENAASKKADEIGNANEYTDSAVEVADGVVVSRAMSSGVMEVFSTGRGMIWREALDYLAHHPVELLLGMGSGDVIDRMKAYNPDRFYSYHLHNSFLEVLARGGVFMLGCLLWALCLLVKPAARALVADDGVDPGLCVLPALLGMLLATGMVEAMLFTDASAYNMLFFCAAARLMRPHAAPPLS